MKIKDREIDLSKGLPLTLGDLRRLKKDHGLSTGSLNTEDPDVMWALLLYVARKVDSSVTEEDIDSVTVPDLPSVASELVAGMKVVDRPTLTPSTSSPPATDGASER